MRTKNNAEIVVVDRGDLVGYYEDNEVELHSFKKEVRSFFVKADMVIFRGRDSYSKLLINRFSSEGVVNEPVGEILKELKSWIEISNNLSRMVEIMSESIELEDVSEEARMELKDIMKNVKYLAKK